jgi:uncharacterized protein YbcI
MELEACASLKRKERTKIPYSKGDMEDTISRRLTQWEKQYFGKGSLLVKTDILRNMIIVVLKGTLTPAEQKLSETSEGKLSIKRSRTELLESGIDHLMQTVHGLTGVKITSFHTDMSTQTGERVMILMLSDNLEKQLQEGYTI